MDDRPLCFVLMPFGTKKDPAGGSDIDFDSMYEQGLRPGIEDAGMEPLRADEERTGGIIQAPRKPTVSSAGSTRTCGWKRGKPTIDGRSRAASIRRLPPTSPASSATGATPIPASMR